MHFHHYPDIEVYADQVLPFLEREEAANNLMIGLILHLQQKTEEMATASLYAVKKGEEVVLAAMRTSPNMPFLVYGEPAYLEKSAQKLCEALGALDFSTERILGPTSYVEPFVEIWKKYFTLEAVLVMALKVFRLDRLKTVRMSEGSFRVAEEKDVPLLTHWGIAFDKETFSRDTSQEKGLKMVREKVEKQDLFVWEVDDEVVSMAAKARPTRHGIAVNYVYTPAEHRKKGYATSCVAKLSQHLLDSGYEFCCLFTDAANPTSNKIYQEMGYEWVTDFLEVKVIKG
jgi:predicted GNAT family acetyltransferase